MFRGDETTITLSRGGGLDSSSIDGKCSIIGIGEKRLGLGVGGGLLSKSK